MVEHGNAVRHFHRIVQRQQRHTRGQNDLLRLDQGLGDEQLWGRGIFPALGQMLADPDFVGLPSSLNFS
jgi:hypothetical protein